MKWLSCRRRLRWRMNGSQNLNIQKSRNPDQRSAHQRSEIFLHSFSRVIADQRPDSCGADERIGIIGNSKIYRYQGKDGKEDRPHDTPLRALRGRDGRRAHVLMMSGAFATLGHRNFLFKVENIRRMPTDQNQLQVQTSIHERSIGRDPKSARRWSPYCR